MYGLHKGKPNRAGGGVHIESRGVRIANPSSNECHKERRFQGRVLLGLLRDKNMTPII